MTQPRTRTGSRTLRRPRTSARSSARSSAWSGARSGPGKRNSRGSSLLRLRLGFVVIAMVVSLFGARLVQLQGLDPHAYAAAAAQEGLVNAVVPAKRGEILDRNGVALASSVEGLMIVADPKQTTEQAPSIAKLLANRLGLDYVDTKAKLSKPDSRFVYIDRRVPSVDALAVVEESRQLGYQGLYTRGDAVRDYPAHDVAANIVGFLGQTDGDKTYGSGLELTFGQELAGKDGSERYEVGGGNRIPLGEDDTVPPVNGESMTLTIDRDTQWYLQRLVAKAVRDARADSGMAVVMDTQTGEILGLADVPTIDSAHPTDSPKRDRGAKSLTSPYEPGSVEKVLTMAALLEEGKVTPRTRLMVPEAIQVQDAVIHDYFDHGALPLTLTGVLAKSSNVGTLMAARRITADKLRAYLTSFGLGTATGIGVEGESRGSVPDLPWADLTQSTVAFGQGLSVNAVQMAAAVNAIANGGVYVSPSLVEGGATTSTGQTVGTDQTTTRRVVSEKTARQVRNMMEAVVSPRGIAQNAQIAGYRVAGKTGTAQVAKNGVYQDGNNNVSFAGFAPADEPRFTVYVVVRHPRNGGGGGSIGGPVFQKMMSHLLRSYGIAPTGSTPSHLPVCWAECTE